MPSPNVTILGAGPNLRTEVCILYKLKKKRPVIKIYIVLYPLTAAIFHINNCVDRIITAVDKTKKLPFNPYYTRGSYTCTHTSMPTAADIILVHHGLLVGRCATEQYSEIWDFQFPTQRFRLLILTSCNLGELRWICRETCCYQNKSR